MTTRMLVPAPPTTGRQAVTVVTTDRWEDVREALTVVHDGFVEAGYMAPQPSGRRMIGPYLNDDVVFSLAYVGEEIAGVIALIPDGPFGLPSDDAFRDQTDLLRSAGRPLFESGSLVVRRSCRRHTRKILAGLFAGHMRVLRETPGATTVVSVEPGQESFYWSLSGATPLSGPRDHYGAPAVLLATDYPRMVDLMGRSRTNGQRMVRDLVLGSGSGWLVDRRSGERWPVDEVAALIEEQVSLDRLLQPLLTAEGASLPTLGRE
jgi:hypothetical protein